MGKLYKRGGTYYADYFNRAGKRVRESTRTDDPKVARARLRDLELQTTDRGTHETEALGDALDYFVKVTLAGRSAGTVRSYSQKAAHLHRVLGDVQADSLSRETVERYIATRIDEGAHRHSVHKELVVLRGALKSAKQRDRFHGAFDVVPRFDSGYVPRTTYLTPEQFDAMLDALVRVSAKAKPSTIEFRAALKRRRAFYCAMIALASPRRGELEAMRWEKHVDVERRMFRIPKGKTNSRPVAMHPALVPWIEAMIEDIGPVVEPWANVGRDLPAACKRAGVPRCTPNDLRRTFASWLVQAGTSLLVVSRLLGHKSTRMVDLVYGQLDDATLTAAISRLPGGCDAGVSHEKAPVAHGGTTGHSPSAPTITNSVENPQTSSENRVPGDGVEPPTRGFSVLSQIAPKRAPRKAKLKLVG